MIGADQTTTGQKFKIALIVDSNISSKYVYELAQWGQQQGNLEISHLIIQKSFASSQKGLFDGLSESPKGPGIRHLWRSVLSGLIWRIESKQIMRDRVHKDHLTQHNLFDVVKSSISVEPIISESGTVCRYGDRDVQEIRTLDFDILISCGSGMLQGEILKSARFGIISLHHADDRINSGGPPAFWEVYGRQDSTGFTIQQLTEEREGGNVLFRGHLPTKGYWQLNRAAVSAKSNFYLKKVLSDIAATRRLSVRRDSYPYFNALSKNPGSRVLFIYLLRLILNSINER